MPNVFGFRPGHSVSKVNPQAVGEELERIRAERGQLLASSVVEEAQNPESPLHEAFTWDDSLAAQQHRLAQARKLIVSIRILNSPTAKPVPAFVSVRSPELGRSYLPTIEALSDEQLRFRVLNDVRQALESIERKWAHFQELDELLGSLKKAVG